MPVLCQCDAKVARPLLGPWLARLADPNPLHCVSAPGATCEQYKLAQERMAAAKNVVSPAMQAGRLAAARAVELTLRAVGEAAGAAQAIQAASKAVAAVVSGGDAVTATLPLRQQCALGHDWGLLTTQHPFLRCALWPGTRELRALPAAGLGWERYQGEPGAVLGATPSPHLPHTFPTPRRGTRRCHSVVAVGLVLKPGPPAGPLCVCRQLFVAVDRCNTNSPSALPALTIATSIIH